MGTASVHYSNSVEGVRPDALLGGFFEGWTAPPAPTEHLQLLENSTHRVLAISGTQVVGFVSALSDGVLAAYIPLLEVLPSYRGRGIGRELVRRLLYEVGPLYMIDVICDEAVLPFYESLGFMKAGGGVIRNREWRVSN